LELVEAVGRRIEQERVVDPDSRDLVMTTALVAVIQEAWIGGVSTRRVDDLVQAMGLSGISKSQVSKLCKSLPSRKRGRSTSACMPFSIGRSAANGRICGSTPLT
jgi:hypothetical protein